MEKMIGKTKLNLIQGDLTKQEVDAIVNAANSGLMGGGGVDGAIHRAGGQAILAECKEIIKRQGRLPVGEAVITTGGQLPARYVIHTVGPIWRGGNAGEAALLKKAYQNSLQLAKDRGLKTIAFPSISTGAYGYPLEEAAGVALSAIMDYLTANPHFSEVRMVLFNEEIFRVYSRTAVELEKT